MKILVLDNYDSFTYNIVHALKKFTNNIDVFRNDEIALEDVEKYDKILLSPGPGIPDEANLLKPIIEKYAPTKSIFGICLGQQAIGEVFGGTLLNTQEVFHGVQSTIEVIKSDEILFKDLDLNLKVGRYHSWVVSNENFPEDLEITAVGPKGEVMALRHKTYDVRGVQFHPESILTPEGEQMIENWLKA
ncbi:anthranilate synthase component II [Faecalibacter macacae]|uniref:Aminodeoxychorismate/anthranilate synthase component II n=1 Tax=Faecalibacter macacae TaxID=1859289 RepID=A0A3L9M6B6_9FLAO|nr:aminodeoxychorismate/anthranilate synthase component II [Faecalibacter macacae]RLZ08331.1 aminodeoxychorismate/anthranilate synthase component II [Faecalibacter macacae]